MICQNISRETLVSAESQVFVLGVLMPKDVPIIDFLFSSNDIG